MFLLSFRYDRLFGFDVLLDRQEQQHDDQDAVGDDLKAEEEERGDRPMVEHAAVVEQIEEGDGEAVDHR